MAALHAGVKRSFQEMRGLDQSASHRPKTKETLHHIATSRQPSQTPTPYNGPVAAMRGIDTKPRNVTFAPHASILLIGVRGVGKSSLAFLAATAYSRRLIEFERAFAETTGATRTEYRKLHGTAEYHMKHSEVLTQLLDTFGEDSVIVCSFADLESDGARMIQSFAQSHPVIYVMRDVSGIQNYIRVWSEERIRDLIRASEGLLRDCSNYEFFNVSETLDKDFTVSEGPRWSSANANGPFLTLKRTEHDFLKLLRNIIGNHSRSISHQSAYPLSKISVDEVEFTSAVTLAAQDILAHRIDLDEAQIGVDAVQLVLATSPNDGENWKLRKHGCFNMANEAFAILRRHTILPVIVSIEGGDNAKSGGQITHVDLLNYCLRLGSDYCALDLSLDEPCLSAFMNSKSHTKVIGQFLPPHRLREGWHNAHVFEIYQKAQALQCDLVKIAMPNGTLDDNFAIQAFQQRIAKSHPGGPRLIAYCSGRQGRTSMCFNSILTPVCPSSDALDLGDRQYITSKERSQALFAGFVCEPMRFLIYGANVSFSLSPAMHNAAYEACGMPHTYRTHSASDLDDLLSLVREADFGGAAIVQPFKTRALPLVDVLSPQAKAIGALNTLIPLRAGSFDRETGNVRVFHGRNRTGPVIALYGDNTDWIGIRACIRRGLSPANTVRPQTSGLVCGAGGMARAAIYAMISLGVRSIFVCNRTKGNAEELAKHYNQLIKTNAITDTWPSNNAATRIVALESFNSEWPKDVRHPTMIVSCIPTQTTDGTPTNFTLPKDWLSSKTGGVVVEMAYMPVVTPLVRQVQSEGRKGWILMDGLDMLPEQAFAQFELFTGRRAPRKLMRDEVFRHYSEDEYPPHGALNTDSPTQS